MNTKILVLTITLLLCISCSLNKAKQVETNTDTTAVLAQSETSERQKMTDAEIAAAKILLGSMGVDTMSLSENMTDEQVDAALEAIAIYTANPNNKSLNEIRFGHWTEKDWYDNDYFRFLRKCIDDCLKGVDSENTRPLQDYRTMINGRFFIYDAEPYIDGGLFITLGFLEQAEKVYRTVVYSNVDEDTEKITGYRLRGFRELEETSDITKEEILQIIKEHPENKLW